MFYKKKILADLPLLLDKGIIDEQSKKGLELYYSSEEDSVYEKAKRVSLYLLGAVFIILGLGLFLNYNWSEFSNPVKSVIMLSPLCMSFVVIFYAIKKRTTLTYTIALALNLSGLILALLAPSVIYNTMGNELDFATALVFLFCPVAIFFRQSLGYLACGVLLCVLKGFLLDVDFSYNLSVASFAYLFFGVIVSWQVLAKRDNNIYETLLNVASVIALCISFAIEGDGVDSRLFIAGFALVSIGVYMNKLEISAVALTICTFMLCLFSSSPNMGKSLDFIVPNDIILNLSTLVVVLAGILFFCLGAYERRNFFALGVVLLIFVHTCIYIFAAGTDTTKLTREVLCNISALALFALLFAYGIKEKRLLILNSSFLVIFFYSLIKFTDDDWSLLGRSGLFLGVGIAMIVSNIILNKRIKADENV